MGTPRPWRYSSSRFSIFIGSTNPCSGAMRPIPVSRRAIFSSTVTHSLMTDGTSACMTMVLNLTGTFFRLKFPGPSIIWGLSLFCSLAKARLGLRILFAFTGVLSFFPIYAVLKSRLKYPAFITALILISPQIVLLQRNARYYPLLILLYACLLWHLTRDFKKPRNHFLLALLIFILLFSYPSFCRLMQFLVSRRLWSFVSS